MELHDHDGFYEIAVVLDGAARHESGGITVEAKPMDAFVIPLGTAHLFRDIHDLKLLNIYYWSSWLVPVIHVMPEGGMLSSLFFAADFHKSQEMRAPVHFQIAGQTLDLLMGEFSQMQTMAFGQDSRRNLFLTGCFLKILARMAEDYSYYHALPAASPPLHSAVYRLLEALDQASVMGEAISLANCAERLSLSLGHLTHLFTKQVGIPPYKYLTNRRLEHAKSLLLSHTANMTEIAYKFGFANSAHFSRTFKEHFGFTPSDFRKQAARRANFRP